MEIFAAVCFAIACADLLFDDKLHLGTALKEGLGAITELLLLMCGFMALSPWIASHIAPVVTPFFRMLGCDPSLFAGIIFCCDAGGAYLAKQIAFDPQAALYNGLIVASFFGAAMTGVVPLSLTNTSGRKREAAVRGLSIAFIALPFSCLVTGTFCRMPLLLMMKNTWPLLILSLLLLCCLVYFTQKTVSFFSVLAILIRAAALTGFSIAILQEAAGIVILEGLTPLDEIYPVIVRIGVFLGGILPFFTVLQKALQRPLIRLSRRIGISLTGVSYLFLSTANDIPTLLNLDIMDENSIMLNVAYAMITAYTVGDFLAFTLTFAPHLAIPMMLGRLLCGLLIIMICLCVIRKTPAHSDSNKAEQAG